MRNERLSYVAFGIPQRALTARNERFELSNHRLHVTDNFLFQQPAQEVMPENIDGPVTRMIIGDMLNVFGATTNLAKDPQKLIMVGVHAKQLGYEEQILATWWNYDEIKDLKQGEVPEDYKPRMRIFINPEITEKSKETNIDDREGCFSLPKRLYANVPRSDSVSFRALEVDIEEFLRTGNVVVTEVAEQTPDKFTARVLQHESDHGDGKRCFADAEDGRRVTDMALYKQTEDQEKKGGEREGFEVITEAEMDKLRTMSTPMPSDGDKTIVVMRSSKAA